MATDKEIDTIIEFIQYSLELMESKLDKASINEVRHYLMHNEYEMAFEGLFIEIIKLGEASNIDLVKSLDIGRALKLDKHSVFEHDFWKKLEDFVGNPKS